MDLEDELMVTSREGRGEGIVSEFGMDMYTRLNLKWITNKDLQGELCSMFLWQPGWEGKFGGEQIHVYVWLSPFAVHLKLSQHCLSAIPQCKIKFKKTNGIIQKKK